MNFWIQKILSRLLSQEFQSTIQNLLRNFKHPICESKTFTFWQKRHIMTKSLSKAIILKSIKNGLMKTGIIGRGEGIFVLNLDQRKIF